MSFALKHPEDQYQDATVVSCQKYIEWLRWYVMRRGNWKKENARPPLLPKIQVYGTYVK